MRQATEEPSTRVPSVVRKRPPRTEHSRWTAPLDRIAAWYFDRVYGTREGPGVLPFYCDPRRVGHFAVSTDELATGGDAALFRLFVALSMYQALRDVVIMRRQRSLPSASVRVLARPSFLRKAIASHPCAALGKRDGFEEACDVWKQGQAVDCNRHTGYPCHVKEATRAFGRMGDLGKLPTSAWLRVWRGAGLRRVLAKVIRETPSPAERAAALVRHFARIHRVGEKLATLYVSALSTPQLAPGLTPWFPEIDGHSLVVVDTNVARAVDQLRPRGAAKSYAARADWLRAQAHQLDLRQFHRDLPRHSPRLLQQALYAYCSGSNRRAAADPCFDAGGTCEYCVPELCPCG